MTRAPSEIEFAAIAAAWSMRNAGVRTAEPATPRWRLAGRVLDAHDAPDVRPFARGPAWRNSGRLD